MATAGINGHKTAAALAGARPASSQGQPAGDRFSDLLAAADTYTDPRTQAQKPAKAWTDGIKNAAAANSDQAATAAGPTAADYGATAQTGETGNAAAQDANQNTDIEGRSIGDRDTDQNPKTDTAAAPALPANATSGKGALPAGAEDIPAPDADIKDSDIKDAAVKDTGKKSADRKDARKKDDDGKQAGPDQTGTGVNATATPNLVIPNMVQAANAAGQQATPQADTATDKGGSSQNTSTNISAPTGTVSSATTLAAAANLASASGMAVRDDGKVNPKDTAKPQPPTPGGTSGTATTASQTGNPATDTASGSTTDMLAALTGKTSGHSKDDGGTQGANTGTASAQSAPAPADLPPQQNAQDTNLPPGPASSQGTQGLTLQSAIPDPSMLGAGSAGIHSLIATAPQGIGTSAGTGTGSAAALMPQTSQINQMPLPLPNMAALGIAIATRSLSGSRQFDIRLDPPELGRVDVRLSIDSTGKASAHLSADQQQTLELLQKDSSGLARALRDAGLNVAQNGLNFSLRQHNGGGANHGGFSPRGDGARAHALSAVASLAGASTVLPPGVFPQPMTGRGRIDISV